MEHPATEEALFSLDPHI